MRIFITGGTGFIGKPLVELLRQAGHRLLVLSRRPPKKKQAGTTLLKGDLSTLSKLKPSLKKFKPETVIHLAWEGIPDYSASQSIKNLKYSLDLMLLAAAIGCKKFIAAGTCWEYGNRIGAVGEAMTVEPSEIFPLTKDCFRRLAESVSRQRNVCLIWTRFFYVYGPGQKQSSLIPHLIKASSKQKRLDIKTPGVQHDFIYVADAARAVAMIVKRAKQSAIYNIGSGKLTTVGQIVKIIHPQYTYTVGASQPGCYADISKIRRAIGWRPQVDIETGIKMTAAWFKQNGK